MLFRSTDCLGHAGFYQRFIKGFSKIAKPPSNLLNKETVFVFNEEFLEAFNTLKAKLVYALMITSPDWGQEFELMCDASDYAVDVVLGQRKGRGKAEYFIPSTMLAKY